MQRVPPLLSPILPALLLVASFGAAHSRAQKQFAELAKQHLPTDNDRTHALAMGDVDADGDLDLVFGNVGQQNRLYLNDGNGRFDAAARLPKDSDETSAVVLGDVDGDRDLDLVIGNGVFPGQQDRLYLNDGKGTFSNATASHLPRDNGITHDVSLGDVDGDGDLDLCVANGSTLFGGQQNRLYLNDGKGRFSDVTASRLPKDNDITRAVALGDVDGDRDLDLVLANGSAFFGGQQNRLYLNEGKGSFSDLSAARLPVHRCTTAAVVLGDVDGDRDLDLVLGNGITPNRLYLNLHRQTDAPLLARIGKAFPVEFYAKPGYARSYHLVVPDVATAEKKSKLGRLGTLGLDLGSMIVLPLQVILPSTGKTTRQLRIPNVLSLAGTTLFSQALIISDLVLSPPGWRFTNVTADKILR